MSSSLKEHLVQSGEYERLAKTLRQRLQYAGWYDSVNSLVTRELASSQDLNFPALTERIEPMALELVPQEIQIEMLQAIKQRLDSML